MMKLAIFSYLSCVQDLKILTCSLCCKDFLKFLEILKLISDAVLNFCCYVERCCNLLAHWMLCTISSYLFLQWLKVFLPTCRVFRSTISLCLCKYTSMLIKYLDDHYCNDFSLIWSKVCWILIICMCVLLKEIPWFLSILLLNLFCTWWRHSIHLYPQSSLIIFLLIFYNAIWDIKSELSNISSLVIGKSLPSLQVNRWPP